MTVLPRSPPVRPTEGPALSTTLDTLATVLLLVLTTTVLYFAREILVPIAIAVLLSFVLSPPVKLLRNFGVGKTISVGIVVLSAFFIAVGLGAILGKQISDLAHEAPNYQYTALRKIEGIRDFATNNPILKRVNTAVIDMTKAPDPKADNAAKSEPPAAPKGGHGGGDKGNGETKPTDNKKQAPMQVEVVSPTPGVLSVLQTAAGVAATPLATAAFVAIFIVFMLMQREDLRNRFIRLVGSGDLHRTTLAMNDAATRLSRYFLAQVLLNTAFGIFIAIALYFIGVPSAILWGIVAMLMRFIPYIGSVGAAIFPILMAAVASTGWSMVIETAALFALTEFVVGQIFEPLLYGHNTGISPIAVVISATFWTWLWGPVGLVLSTPITVCLVVLGRHVDRLAFFDVLLGDAPALTPVETIYQRMLAGDPAEIADHADEFLRDHSLLDYCDQVAMKALLMAQIDVRRGALEESRQTRIRDAMRDLVEDLADQKSNVASRLKIVVDKAPAALTPSSRDAGAEDETSGAADDLLPHGEIAAPWKAEKAVVCVAGRTPLDEAAAHLLADLLGRHGIGAHVEPAESLATNNLSHLAGAGPQLVILSFLDADLSVAQARFGVRRLRRHLPDAPLVAAFWMADHDAERTTGLCADVRCDTCVSNLPQAIKLCLERAVGETIADAA